ncbi:hypothetical protein [Aurantibacter sp.]|uniref:hypothetical protein n=1 Tax=Aurantibacter sp. TaxID=2807103 RepID=UPI0035C87D68
MRTVLTCFILLLSLLTSAQDIDCSDFKTGVYIIPADETTKTPHTLTRTEKHQIEEDGTGDKIYTDIKWINDCTYILMINEDLTTRPISETERLVNDYGGVRIEIIKLIENGYEFSATVDFEGDVLTHKGRLYFKN